MFCDEHGTIDYCPECMQDSVNSAELDALKQAVNRFKETKTTEDMQAMFALAGGE